MRLSIYLFIIIFCFQSVYAQNGTLTKEEIKKKLNNLDIVNGNKEENILKIESLVKSSEKINYKEGITEGKISLLKISYWQSDIKKMLELINEIESMSLTDNEQLSTLHTMKHHANNSMGIEKEAFKNLKDALVYSDKVEDTDKKHYLKSIVYNNFANFYDYKKPDSLIYYLKKELQELEKMNSNNLELKFEKDRSTALNNLNIGNFYLGVHEPQRLDLAEPYYLEAYNYRTINLDLFEKLDLQILCGIGRFYMENGEYEKSIELANEVLEIEKKKKNPPFRLFALMLIADSNAGLKNPEKQAKFTKLYADLNDSLNKASKKEVGQQFDKLITKVEQKNASNVKSIILVCLGFVFLLGILFWVYWTQKNKVLHKKYEAIISKIKSETDTQTQTEAETQIYHEEKVDDNQVSPTVGITDETIKALSRRLEKFEQSKLFLKKDMSSPSLANHLNTNTKYLTEIIKLRSNISYTSYINGLRIGYVTRKLVEDPVYREYKIEYLAEECGYASRQVFINAFKRETGVTPSYFIENLKKDNVVKETV